MFSGCYTLIAIPLLDTSNVTDMGYMFNGCYSLASIPLLDTSKVTDMGNMFTSCQSLAFVKLKNLNKSISLNKSTLLNKESLLYIINNEAATEAITITLKSYAYERLANDADIVAALANHPNVSLAK